MCCLEDVYHVKCKHWADKPRNYSRCSAASIPGYTDACYNAKKYGFVSDDSYCRNCVIINHRTCFLTQGTWLSITQDRETGRLVVIVRGDDRINETKGHHLLNLSEKFNMCLTPMQDDHIENAPEEQR